MTPIPSCPGYHATVEGEVYDPKGRCVRTRLLGKYLVVDVKVGESWTVKSLHLLICETFLGPRPSPRHEAHHKDENKQNPRLDNLEWLTIEKHKDAHRSPHVPRPDKPFPKFPLSANLNGQWWKKINTKPYYFGTWKDDLKGEQAIKEYTNRLPGILAGTDHLRHLAAPGGRLTVGELMQQFLTQRRTDVKAGTLSEVMYRDYNYELANFTAWIKGTTPVDALKPEHFAGYVRHLIETRNLKARSRKRAQALIKAMFRWGADKCPVPDFGSAFKSPSVTKGAIRKERARAGLVDYSGRIVTGEEIDKLLAACKGNPNMRAIILLGINCGLGPADIGRLCWRHIDLSPDLKVGTKLDYPRGKTGNDRKGFLWKITREAIEAVLSLKHTNAAYAKDGQNALVFITRKRRPYYSETPVVGADGRFEGVKISNAISITFGRMARILKLSGVTFYRLRHTFKTLGKKAKDRDALNLCMGHATHSIEGGYDHELVNDGDEINFKRVKRVALMVKHRLWPKPKQVVGTDEHPPLKIAGDDGHAEKEAA